MGITNLKLIGLDHWVFRFNMGPSYFYSDMDGYGSTLPMHITYLFYWFLLGLFMLLGTWCWWIRGISEPFLGRLRLALLRAKDKIGIALVFLVVIFLSTGFYLHYEDTVLNPQMSSQERSAIRERMKSKYDAFRNIVQPKIVSVNINMNIYPESLDYKSDGDYVLVNQSDEWIDTFNCGF